MKNVKISKKTLEKIIKQLKKKGILSKNAKIVTIAIVIALSYIVCKNTLNETISYISNPVAQLISLIINNVNN